jgi:hypothetical protein
MAETSRDQIRTRIQAKRNAELLAIIRTDDRQSYTDEALDVIAEELRRRGVDLAGETRAPFSSMGQAEDGTAGSRSVIVTDIRMPFGSMVAFMIKWAIASIPAAVLLAVLGAVLVAILGGVFRTFVRALMH